MLYTPNRGSIRFDLTLSILALSWLVVMIGLARARRLLTDAIRWRGDPVDPQTQP